MIVILTSMFNVNIHCGRKELDTSLAFKMLPAVAVLTN